MADKYTEERILELQKLIGKAKYEADNVINVNVPIFSVTPTEWTVDESIFLPPTELNGKNYLLIKQDNPAENGLYVIQSLFPCVIKRQNNFNSYYDILDQRIVSGLNSYKSELPAGINFVINVDPINIIQDFSEFSLIELPTLSITGKSSVKNLPYKGDFPQTSYKDIVSLFYQAGDVANNAFLYAKPFVELGIYRRNVAGYKLLPTSVKKNGFKVPQNPRGFVFNIKNKYKNNQVKFNDSSSNCVAPQITETKLHEGFMMYSKFPEGYGAYAGDWDANANDPDIFNMVSSGNLQPNNYLTVTRNGTTDVDGTNYWEVGSRIYNSGDGLKKENSFNPPKLMGEFNPNTNDPDLNKKRDIRTIGTSDYWVVNEDGRINLNGLGEVNLLVGDIVTFDFQKEMFVIVKNVLNSRMSDNIRRFDFDPHCFFGLSNPNNEYMKFPVTKDDFQHNHELFKNRRSTLSRSSFYSQQKIVADYLLGTFNRISNRSKKIMVALRVCCIDPRDERSIIHGEWSNTLVVCPESCHTNNALSDFYYKWGITRGN